MAFFPCAGLVRTCSWLPVRMLLMGVLAAAGVSLQADTLTIGVISFDNLIPAAPGSPGVNVFTLYNFTGSNSLPPSAPIVTPLDFLNTTVTLNGLQVENVGTITPGSTQSPSVEFPTTDNFTSADFSADLSSTTFSANGRTYLAASDVVTATLLPSSPPDLAVGVDFAVITIQASPLPTTVPEPASASLAIGGLALAVWFGWKRKRA